MDKNSLGTIQKVALLEAEVLTRLTELTEMAKSNTVEA